MADAWDVADALLQRCGPMSTIKLQKLVYYSQAWSATWLDRPMFPERVEAWKNGPVVRDLFNSHRGARELSALGRGEASNLAEDESRIVDFVCSFYGSQDAADLVLYVHEEDPWLDAYEQGQNTEVTVDAMANYYAQLEDLNDQSWVWLSGAYESVRASEADLAAGDFERTLSDSDFLAALD